MNKNNLELKIFAAALLLQELLDETVGDTRFKHKMRHSINGISKELDKVLTVEVANDVSILVNKVIQVIDDTIEEELKDII